MRNARRLAQRQIEQALDRQAKLKRRLAVFRAAAPIAAGTAVPAHVLVQPGEQRTARFERRIFPGGRSVLWLCWGTHAVSLRAHRLGHCTCRFVQQR